MTWIRSRVDGQEQGVRSMDISFALGFIKTFVKDNLAQEGIEIVVSDETFLLGSESALDSMKLVELCLALEDKASELGFEFDWTSDAAMSRSRSMFRSVRSLAEAFLSQYEVQK